MDHQARLIFGAHPFGQWDKVKQKEFLQTLQINGINDIDTAIGYEDSEEALGARGAPSNFEIHTKARGFKPRALTRESILSAMEKSLADLRCDMVTTYFLHSPDHDTPIEETVDTIQELYAAGKFKKFGLSNFVAEEVERIHEYASSKGYVLPTVYQGNYNPVGRRVEKELFPLLRRLKIAFWAYSPLAGGFLVKSPEFIKDGKGSRWDRSTFIGQLYQSVYNRRAYLEALTEWEKISQETNIKKSALAYRWVCFHSAIDSSRDDSLVIGASSPEQLTQTLEALKAGPLEKHIVARIELVWELVRHEAALDNFNN